MGNLCANQTTTQEYSSANIKSAKPAKPAEPAKPAVDPPLNPEEVKAPLNTKDEPKVKKNKQVRFADDTSQRVPPSANPFFRCSKVGNSK